MDRFWAFARRMLRHKRLIVLAIGFAVISAGGLGAGLVALVPALDNILGEEGRTLPQLAGAFNEEFGDWVQIPAAWIEGLPDDQWNAVLWVIVALGVLTVIGATANFLHAYLSLTVVSRTIAGIRRDVFRRVVHMPLKTVAAQGPSDLISRIIVDSQALSGGFIALLSKGVAQVTKGAAAFIAALLLDWRITGVAVLVAPLLYTVIRKLGKRVRRASRSALKGQSGLYHIASEALHGLRVVKVHTTERAETGRFHRVNKEVIRQELRARTARALSSPLVETLAIFVLGILALISAKAIIDGQADPVRFLATLGALGVAGASLKPLTGLINDIQQASGAAERLQQVLSEPTEPGHDAKLPKLGRHGTDIRFEDVTFTYEGAEEPSLRDVSLTIEHGLTVAIVGPNGSGKTTLLSLIPRLFDPDSAQGCVKVDGRDIREVSVRSLRRQIGVVTQEVVLFRGTIGSNIAYGSPSAGPEEIKAAARQARAEEFILEKPGGYDAEVGEDGVGLSGGQRQRIAIARAVLRDPAILLLDEATSMIDADSEAKIGEALAEFAKGRTCVVVAHRLSTVRDADRIVVMDQGRVVDQGSHEELLQRCEVYQLIVKNQLG